MASGPITSWHSSGETMGKMGKNEYGETMETVRDLIFFLCYIVRPFSIKLKRSDSGHSALFLKEVALCLSILNIM